MNIEIARGPKEMAALTPCASATSEEEIASRLREYCFLVWSKGDVILMSTLRLLSGWEEARIEEAVSALWHEWEARLQAGTAVRKMTVNEKLKARWASMTPEQQAAIIEKTRQTKRLNRARLLLRAVL